MTDQHPSDMDRLLSNDPTLKSLEIDGRNAWHNMKMALVEALKANALELTSLEILASVCKCDGLLLADALKGNTTLKTLTVLFPGFLVRAAAEALKVNTTITSFAIFRYPNDLTRDMVWLADALKVNTTLETFQVFGSLEDTAAQELEDALQSNKTLTSVRIHMNTEPNSLFKHNEDGVPWVVSSRLRSLDKAVSRNRDLFLKRFWWHLSLISQKSRVAAAARVMQYSSLRCKILDYVRHDGKTFSATHTDFWKGPAAGRVQLLDADAVISAASVPTQDLVPADLVIQALDHNENPAIILPHEADAVQQVMWTNNVESQIESHQIGHYTTTATMLTNHEDISGRSADGSNQIHLLRFGSAPAGGESWERFRAVLLSGPELAPCREALMQAGLSVELPQGALMFVAPEQYSDSERALKNEQIRSFHIIISADFENILNEILASKPFQQRPKLKKGEHGRRPLAPVEGQNPDLQEPGGHAEQWEVRVERTFLCCVPLQYDARSVSQSSTEVVTSHSRAHYAHYRGSNPRRTTRGQFEMSPDQQDIACTFWQ